MTIPYPRIPPVIVSIGPLAVRWYGVMYGVGYLLGYRLAQTRTARAILPIEKADLDSWIGYLVVGMLVGARLTRDSPTLNWDSSLDPSAWDSSCR